MGSQSASFELTDDSGTLDVLLSGTGITGTLSATPNAVDFQPQPWFDGGQQQGITIQDSPDAGVQGSSATITGPDASLFYIAFGQNCATQQYNPGSTCGMGVGFNPPNGPGVFHAQLEISSDSLSSPLIVPLNATALSGPNAVVTPVQTDFGDVAVGKSVARTVTISNNGDSPLQVQGSFIVSGSPLSFPVTADGCSGQVIDPGSSCQITVSFQPSTVGYRDATIIVLTNTQRNVMPVAFSGTGAPTLGGAATITGTAAAGSRLTCDPVGYPAGTTYGYQWLQNGRPLAGADLRTFVPLDANVGNRLACRITAINSVSQQTVTSPATARLLPMALSGEPGAFTDSESCRVLQTDHLLGVAGHAAVVRYGHPVTPLAPLTLTSSIPLQVRIDGHRVGRGKAVTIAPSDLSAFADGSHNLTIAAAGTTARSRLLLAPCQLAVNLTGGPDRATTLSASSRFGIHSLTFHLPRAMHLQASAHRLVGSGAFKSAGYPTREFNLVGPRTSWDNVHIRLARHTITITRLPIQTGVISITLRPGIVGGRTGNLTATANERGISTAQEASAPASWFR